VNAIEKVGFEVEWIETPSDLEHADRVIFPGVGHFGHCMSTLSKAGFVEPLKQFVASGKPFMGICVGMQALFNGSEESPSVAGLGIIPGKLKLFNSETKAVPHIGWNSAATRTFTDSSLYGLRPRSKYYYVHSYALPVETETLEGWDLAIAKYGDEDFVGAVSKGNVFATQFHPEKKWKGGSEGSKGVSESGATHAAFRSSYQGR